MIPTKSAIQATFLTTILVLIVFVPAVVSLDPALAKAQKSVKVIKVRKDGSGDFKTMTDAINSIPAGNTIRTILSIGPGDYKEKITVPLNKPFITFYGTPGSMPRLVYDGTAAKYGTVNSCTVAVDSDYFVAVNIIFENSAPKPDGKMKGAQAEAIRVSGDKAAFYNCRFIGYQDTVCDDKGQHYFENCFFQGTVDFIFGRGKSLYVRCELHSVADGFAAIAAHAREREEEDVGYVFLNCKVTGTGDIYLGRVWMPRGKVIYANTYMGPNVNPAGWGDLGHKGASQTFFGEYKNTGPGANSGNRASFTKLLTDAQAKTFLDKSYINAATWLQPAPEI